MVEQASSEALRLVPGHEAALVLFNLTVGSLLLRLGAALSGVPQARNSIVKAFGAIAGLGFLVLSAGLGLAGVWPAAAWVLGALVAVAASVPFLRRLYGLALDEAALLTLVSWGFVLGCVALWCGGLVP